MTRRLRDERTSRGSPIPEWLKPYVCFGYCGNEGWTYDQVRNIWVDKKCRRPSKVDGMNNAPWVYTCWGCGDVFICWIFNPVDDSIGLCRKCGGENQAKPFQATVDPIDEMLKRNGCEDD